MKKVLSLFLFILILFSYGCVLSKTGIENNEAIYSDYELTDQSKILEERMEAAFEEINCPEPIQRNLNDSFYKGPMIDTHIHIGHIPEGDIPEYEIRPLMGFNVKMADYACMIETENTSQVFAFFPVWEPMIPQLLEVVNRTTAKYTDRFVPFIMPPDHDDRADGYPTVTAGELSKMLEVYPGLFKGYGEIGLYARGDHGGPKGAPELPPDSMRLMEIYPVIREHKLLVYFHLGEGQKESFERALGQNPDINFIWHGDQLIHYENGKQNLNDVEEILYKYPNAYYGVDELYGDVWLIRPDVTKEQFISHFSDYELLLEKDFKAWKGFIERHPNQVLWGTDRGWNSPWSIDPEVALILNRYSRAFIAGLDPDVQEKFAYKNANKLLDKNQD